ncbi:type II secretion system F family protein, partial [Mycobacterium avium subsp. hominissuis]|nr:type II secretion system F family protein [Mycobacterium avium subsp. hominissuis]
MDLAAVLLAAAVLMGPGPSLTRRRAGTPARPGGPRREPGPGRGRGPDPLAIASCLDVLAVCLGAGMAVSAAAAAAVPSAPAQLGRVLRRAADLLALGADPAVAWSVPPD